MFAKLFGRKKPDDAVERLYGEIMAAARRPQLYLDDYGAPDTVEGRFDLLVLHTFLTVRRLATLEEPGPAIAQDLSDRLFKGFDRALREMGVGDLAVPKRIKKMAEDYFGRVQSYEAALAEEGDATLAAALARNVYGSADPAVAGRLVRYVRAAAAAFAVAPLSALTPGPAPFPDPAAIQ